LPDPPVKNSIGNPFIELQSVDSTNNYALAQVHAGLAQHGTVFFAHEQWAGKGQRGKTWIAGKDSSLILSAVIDPAPLLITQQFQLSACAAVSFCEFFSRYAGNDTHIKWPNDMYWQDRKAGGILIENIIGGKGQLVAGSRQSAPDSYRDSSRLVSGWQWAVMGIGVNINQGYFSSELKNPVSLRQITGRQFDTMDMARELCLVLDRNFNSLIRDGFEEIYRYYNNHLYKKGQPVRFRKGNRMFEATLKSVSPEGKLVVQHATEEELSWGEVEWILPGL
jgi:BirA family transcriptional regulator, biotin operon repressor / biotin---[acetyl-CoA-carboxylase] ligase